jgi:hypothetical protein
LSLRRKRDEDLDETSSVEITIKKAKKAKRSGGVDDLQSGVSDSVTKEKSKMAKSHESTKILAAKAKQAAKLLKTKKLAKADAKPKTGQRKLKAVKKAEKIMGMEKRRAKVERKTLAKAKLEMKRSQKEKEPTAEKASKRSSSKRV